MQRSLLLCLLAAAMCGSEPVVTPVSQHLKAPSAATVLCSFPGPLADCRVRLNERWGRYYDETLEFGDGHETPQAILKDSGGSSWATASYAGGSLEGGDCGVTLDLIVPGYLQAVLVECFGQDEDNNWTQGFGLVAAHPSDVVASNTTSPHRVVARTGDTVSLSLLMQGPLDRCTALTPSAGGLELFAGHWDPPAGIRYRAVGGFGGGRCGFQLTNVSQADAGFWIWFGQRLSQAAVGLQMALVVVEDRVAVKAAACGVGGAGQALIAGGQNAVQGQLPWHAGLYKLQPGGEYEQQCGGTLVSTRRVITAAHCLYDDLSHAFHPLPSYRVALGKIARSWKADAADASVQRFSIAAADVTEHYVGARGNFLHDVAVLTLDRDAVITTTVAPACLDRAGAYAQMAAGTLATVAGWGATAERNASPVLQWTQLAIVNFNVCRRHLRKIHAVHLLTPDKLCAGWEKRNISVCRGDSGGGLLVRDPATRRSFLVGVVSVSFEGLLGTGKTCNSELFTGFTKLSVHKNWLESFF